MDPWVLGDERWCNVWWNAILEDLWEEGGAGMLLNDAEPWDFRVYGHVPDCSSEMVH